MRIAGYLEKLSRIVSPGPGPDMIEAVPECGAAFWARITEITEYGCAFEFGAAEDAQLAPGGAVRIRWENFPEGVHGRVVRCNEETGFAAVRFSKMTKTQYVQLLEFIGEKARTLTEIEEYGCKVS